MEEAPKCNPLREARNPGPLKHALYEDKSLVVVIKLKTICPLCFSSPHFLSKNTIICKALCKCQFFCNLGNAIIFVVYFHAFASKKNVKYESSPWSKLCSLDVHPVCGHPRGFLTHEPNKWNTNHWVKYRNWASASPWKGKFSICISLY